MQITINRIEATAARKPTPIASPSKEEVARSKELASKLVTKFATAAKRAKLDVTGLTSNSYPSLERAGFYVHHITGKLGQVTFIATVAQKGASNYYETIKAEGRLASGGYSALPKAKAKGTAAEIIEPILNAAATRDRRGAPRDSMGGGQVAVPAKVSGAEKTAFAKSVREVLKKHGLSMKSSLRQEAYGTPYIIETPNSTAFGIDVLLYLYPEENRMAAYSLPKKPHDAKGNRPKPTKHPLGAPLLDDEAAIAKMVGKVKRFHAKLENPRKPTKTLIKEMQERRGSSQPQKQPSSFLSVEAEVLRLQEERDNLVKQYDLKIQKLLDSRNPLKQK